MTPPHVAEQPGLARGREPLALPASAVFLLSACIIGLELALMRCLSVASWHHFSYLVVSTALLGFGASGTLLTLIGERLKRCFCAASVSLTVLFALSISLCFRAAQALPLDARFVLYDRRQACLMIAYHLLMLVPFLLGALVIGLALMRYGERVHVIYAANLTGSGAGGLGMILLMFALPEAKLLTVTSVVALGSAMLWVACALRAFEEEPSPLMGRTYSERVVALLALVVAGSVALAAVERSAPLSLRIDQYKALAEMQRWESQRDAQRVLTLHSPRGRLDVYASPRFHQTLFAGLTAPEPPPPEFMLLTDGQSVGAVFRINSAEGASILDHTPQSVPYRLRPSARVLLLDEAGGTNVWLARRFGATEVTIVQQDPKLVEVMTGPLAGYNGNVFAQPGVTAVAQAPRTFLEACPSTERYDIIHIVRAEGFAAGVSNLLSLHEDFLLTREGMALCLARLKPNGLVALTRGIQLPPRDNVKVLVTLAEALESRGVKEPGRHIIQVRNYLAVTTLASPNPLDESTCAGLRAACEELLLDVEWAPCQVNSGTTQFSRIEGPTDRTFSYYHYAALETFSDRRQKFLDDYVYNVRPATDDSPYFFNFFRWKSLRALKEAYGESWFQRMELGYVVLVAALAEAFAVGAVFILLPLLWMGRTRQPARGRLPTLAYFLLLGLAFMLLEMALILKLTEFLGDPILSAGGVMAAFLMFSGLGSGVSSRAAAAPRHAVSAAAISIAVLAVAGVLCLDKLFVLAAPMSMPARVGLSVAVVAPAAFLMGWLFPTGLSCVRRGSPALMPWAWGVNGFASVAAPPLAVLLAVHAGYSTVFLLGAVLYLLAGLVIWALPGASPTTT